MKAHSPMSIRHKLQALSLFLVLTTSILGMVTTLLFSLRMEYQNLDRNLMNSAQVLAQSPGVAGSRTLTPSWWPTTTASSGTARTPPLWGRSTRMWIRSRSCGGN